MCKYRPKEAVKEALKISGERLTQRKTYPNRDLEAAKMVEVFPVPGGP